MTHPGYGEGLQLRGAAGMEQGKPTTEESGAACRDCRELGVRHGETPGNQPTAV